MSKGNRVSAFVTAGVMALTTAGYFPTPVNAVSAGCPSTEVANSLGTPENGVYKLQSNVNMRVVASEDMTIDLNGCTLENGGGSTIIVNAGVTVTIIDSSAAQTGVVRNSENAVANNGTLIVKGGTFIGGMVWTGDYQFEGGNMSQATTLHNRNITRVTGGVFQNVIHDALKNKLLAVMENGLSIYNDGANLVVEPTISSIDVASENLEVTEGQTGAIGARVTGSTTDFTYESSDESVVTVGADGNYTAVGVGHAVVTVATTYDPSVTTTVDFVSKSALQNFTAYDEAGAAVEGPIEIHVNERYDLNIAKYGANAAVYSYAFDLNNYTAKPVDNVADMRKVDDEHFHIFGLSAGETTQYITLTSRQSEYGLGRKRVVKPFEVKVYNALTEVTVEDDEITLDDETAGQIVAEANDGTKATLSYAVTEGDAATIELNGDGTFTAKKAGSVTVTVTATDDLDGTTATKDVKITVNPVIKSIEVADDDQTLYVNTTDARETTFELSDPTILDKDDEAVDLTDATYEYYLVEGNGVVELDGRTVTALAAGTAKIGVKGHLNASADQTDVESTTFVTVTVESAFNEMTIVDDEGAEVEALTVREGEGADLKLKVVRETADVSFNIEAADGVTVTENSRELTIATADDAGNEEVAGRVVTVKVTPVVAGEALDNAAKTLALTIMPRLKELTVDDTQTCSDATDMCLDASASADFVAHVNDGVNAKYSYEVLRGNDVATVTATEKGLTVAGEKAGTIVLKLVADNARADDLSDEQKSKVLTVKVSEILDTDSVEVENAENGVVNANEFDTDKFVKVAYDVLGADQLSSPRSLLISFEKLDGDVEVAASGAIDTSKVGSSTVKVTANYHSANTGKEYTAEQTVTVKVNSVLQSVEIQENGNATQAVSLDEDAEPTEYDLVTNAVNGRHAAAEFTAESSDDAVKAEIVDGKLVLTPQEVAADTQATVTVKATSPDGEKTVKATLTVDVKNVLQNVEVEDVTVDRADSANLSYTVDVDATAFAESGSLEFDHDTSVVDIKQDASGTYRVTGLKSGTHEVTVTATYGGRTVSSTFNVTVNPILTAVKIDGETEKSVEVKEQSETTYTLSFEDEDVENVTFTATSDNEDLATVTVDGSMLTVRTEEGTGDTTITVTGKDERTGTTKVATLNVTVKPTLLWVLLDWGVDENGDPLLWGEVTAGETIELSPVTNHSEDGTIDPTFTYEIVDQYAYVDEEVEVATLEGNILKGENMGQVLIRVTATYDGETVSNDYSVGDYVEVLPATHTVVEGDGETTYGLTDFSHKVDAEHGKFRHVYLYREEDETMLEPEEGDYVITKGSTVITFKQDYLNELAYGTYHAYYVFTDGYAEGTFVLAPAPEVVTASVKVANTGVMTAEAEGAVASTGLVAGVVAGVAAVVAGAWLAIRRKMLRK